MTFSIPSGQRVAKEMELPVLSKADLSDLKPHGLDDRTPLFFYILREAQLENGERLRPVGARIVAEVFLGLLQGNSSFYLSQDLEWQPSLPTANASKKGDDFTMIDLLRFAGVA